MTISSKPHGVLNGYRSGLEERVADQLRGMGLQVHFECTKVKFTQPIKRRTYLCDFVFSNGIIVETKGRFMTADRQKHKMIKAEHPDLDIRFVFSRSATRISKGSPTSYADWCRQNGFLFGDGVVPPAWANEPPEQARIAALEAATGSSFTSILGNTK